MSWRSIFIEDDSGWPGVGFNPAKGDAEAVGYLARDVAAVGRELEELEELLTTVGRNDGWWRGDAADKFRAQLADLPTYLRQGSESMRACANALNRYHGYLTDMQAHAQNVETEAVPARKDADAKRRHRIDLADQYAGKLYEENEAQRIQKTLDGAADLESAAVDKLNQLIREAEDIRVNWNERAGEAERAILTASENHPPDLSVWNRITDSLNEAWRGFKDWLVDHADLLSTISSGLAAAGLICQFLPGPGTVIGGALMLTSAGFAAGAMAGHAMGMARGNGTSWMKVALDGAGMLPLIGGFKALRGTAVVGSTARAIPLAARSSGLVADGVAQGAGLGTRMVAGVGQAARDSFIQTRVIGPLEKTVASKFGRTFNEAEERALNGVTQAAVKGMSFGNHLYQQATGQDSGPQPSTQTPSSEAFHTTLVS